MARAKMSDEKRAVVQWVLDNVNSDAGANVKAAAHAPWKWHVTTNHANPHPDVVADAVTMSGPQHEFWTDYGKVRRSEIAQSVRDLATLDRLSDTDADDYAFAYRRDVRLVPSVVIKSGRATLSYSQEFASSEGAIAFAILWLSERDRTPWVVACDRCGYLFLADHRSTRFCDQLSCQRERGAKAVSKHRRARKTARKPK